MLERFNMVGGKTLSTPLPPYVKLSEQDCPKSDDEKAKMDKIPYASAASCWQLDVCYDSYEA